jgi:outer membrane protein TolC
LRIAENGMRSSEIGRSIADKARWPRFSIAGNASYAPASLSFGYDPAVSNGGEYGARLVAEQTIYDGGLMGLDIRLAEAEVAGQSLAYQQQARDLVFAVRQAFVDMLLAQSQTELRDSSVNRLADYLGLVERLNESGTVGYTDFLSTQVDLDNARVNAMAAAESLKSARFNLARLMGTANDTTFAIRGSLDTLLIDAKDTLALLPEVVLDRNLDVVAAQIGRTRSQIALAQTKAQWKPSVSVVADAGVVTSRENLLLPRSERYNSVGYSVGVTLDMPLWDWGSRKAQIRRSSLDLKSSSDYIELVRRDVLTVYRTTRTRITGALRRLQSIRQMTETAQKNYLLSTAQYADGAVTASEVLIAQQLLTGAYSTEVEILAEIQSLRAQLAQITESMQDTRP